VISLQIARENPEIESEMLAAVDEVLSAGQMMSSASKEFADDPCSSVKRGNMVSIVKFKDNAAMMSDNLFMTNFRFELPEVYYQR